MGYKDAARILVMLPGKYSLAGDEAEALLVAIGLLMGTKDESEMLFDRMMGMIANGYDGPADAEAEMNINGDTEEMNDV